MDLWWECLPKWGKVDIQDEMTKEVNGGYFLGDVRERKKERTRESSRENLTIEEQLLVRKVGRGLSSSDISC